MRNRSEFVYKERGTFSCSWIDIHDNLCISHVKLTENCLFFFINDKNDNNSARKKVGKKC